MEQEQDSCEYEKDCGRECHIKNRNKCRNWHIWKQIDLDGLFGPKKIEGSELGLKEHDEIISDLERRLKNIGMAVHRNEKYYLSLKNEYGNEGEIDVYGVSQSRKELIAIEDDLLSTLKCGVS